VIPSSGCTVFGVSHRCNCGPLTFGGHFRIHVLQKRPIRRCFWRSPGCSNALQCEPLLLAGLGRPVGSAHWHRRFLFSRLHVCFSCDFRPFRRCAPADGRRRRSHRRHRAICDYRHWWLGSTSPLDDVSTDGGRFLASSSGISGCLRTRPGVLPHDRSEPLPVFATDKLPEPSSRFGAVPYAAES